MIFIYNILTHIVGQLLKIVALFNPKLNLFIKGRKNVFSILEEKISKLDKTIWVHCASLGEFEQGLPIIEQLKISKPDYKIVVTFFSPSGYEVKKNSPTADVITYLPIDTTHNAKRFIDIVHPEIAIFVKYEFWPNYLNTLKKQQIDTYLVSGIFRKEQPFFQWHGKWMQNSLQTFNHFFVQNTISKTLLNTIGFENVSITGDTRFDRVTEILDRDNTLSFIEEFKHDKTTIVYGSSWEDDEAIYIDFINVSQNVKHIIAPHNIHTTQINKLVSKISKSTILFSEMEGKDLASYDIFIADTIGLLTKIYSYADIAYVGGAFKTGLHNTLEPAVFGIPVIIGPKYDKFQEAIDLVERKGIIVVNDTTELNNTMNSLVENSSLRVATGIINANYIKEQAGATQQILSLLTPNS